MVSILKGGLEYRMRSLCRLRCATENKAGKDFSYSVLAKNTRQPFDQFFSEALHPLRLDIRRVLLEIEAVDRLGDRHLVESLLLRAG